jgi:hypothetical protein
MVAIDCGRTRSAAASALADEAPSFQSRVSTAVCDGVRSLPVATSLSWRRSRLNTTRRSRAAVPADSLIPSTAARLN